ncbi:Uncharacterized protein GBIM_03712 [Gryllus bimaculatus]|nr:Uncharacterized protein GBIM_03712 [Gryllus bimaculatus]
MDCESDVRSLCVTTLKELCDSKIQELFEIWGVVGHQNLESRSNVVCKNVEALLNDMVEEETEFRNNLAIEIEELLKESAELCAEVGGNHNDVVAGLEDSSIPLLQVKNLLNMRMEGYRNCKQQRLSEYEDLLQKEQQLVLSMGIKKKPKLTKLPSEEALQEFSRYIEQKFDEERELRHQYEETKLKIEEITAELGISPNTTIHKMLVSDSQFCLSTENMLLLKNLHQDMEQRLEEAKSVAIELREKLSNLWERLHVDYAERDLIFQQYPGHSKTSIDALKAEIQKCEEKKRQNIRVFVEAIREELASWWDKCCYGKLQRQQFRSFYSDCYTEDLLELHEIEIEKLKRYFSENIDILELAKKREKLWKKMMDLDERAHDPKRLFANRGGQLLREEKERKAIQKDLPILDKELGCLLDTYESKHNVPFLYDGTDLRDIIKSKWEDFQKKKEEEKLARKKGKDHTLAEKTLSATKRKNVATPASVPSKVCKSSGPPSGASSTASSTGSKVVRRIFDRRGNVENRVTTRTKYGFRNRGVQSPEASYTDFQYGLEKRSADQEMVRSSVVPSRLLKERNGQNELACIKERVATPAKPPRKNSVTRSCTNLSEFRTPQAVRKASPGLSRSRSAPRLATARGHLPIII